MEAWPRRPWAGAARVRLRGDAGGRTKPGHKDPAPTAPHVHTHALLLTLAQCAAGGILLPPAATSALQSPAASQARPQTPGSRFRVGNPDSNNSERTHMPPSMQRGTGGDGQHPVPTQCSDLRVLGSVGQGNLLGTETRQFPGGRELRQGKALPKPSPLAKQLISSGLSPPAHRESFLTVSPHPGDASSLWMLPWKGPQEKPSGRLLRVRTRLSPSCTARSSSSAGRQAQHQRDDPQPDPRSWGRGHPLGAESCWRVPRGCLSMVGGWVGSGCLPVGAGVGWSGRDGGAEGTLPIPAPKVAAASGLNGFDYLISLWFNG